jgi:hypothetical protein
MGETHKCEARVHSDFRSHQCYKDAKIERDGKHYCTIHDPVRIEEKRKTKEDKWKKEWDERKKRTEYQNSAAAYCKKKGLTIEDLKDAVSEESE